MLIRLLNLCHNDRSLLVLELTKKCKCIIFDTKDCNKKAFLYEVFIYWGSLEKNQNKAFLVYNLAKTAN